MAKNNFKNVPIILRVANVKYNFLINHSTLHSKAFRTPTPHSQRALSLTFSLRWFQTQVWRHLFLLPKLHSLSKSTRNRKLNGHIFKSPLCNPPTGSFFPSDLSFEQWHLCNRYNTLHICSKPTRIPALQQNIFNCYIKIYKHFLHFIEFLCIYTHRLLAK